MGGTRTNARAASVLLATVAIVVAAGRARAQQGPAMSLLYTNVKTPDGECCGFSAYAEHLPPDRPMPLPAPNLSRTTTGRYVITGPGAAPFAGQAPRAGYFVDVTAVGSNAHCFEVGTGTKAGRDLVSTVGCVDPHGAPTDAQFSWSYRADSLDYPQHTEFRSNFGYAHVRADGQVATGFTPARGAVISAQRVSAGTYKVKLARLGTRAAQMDRKMGSQIQISNICAAGPCGTRVCVPTAFNVGDTATTVDVRCAGPDGQAIDGEFRLFVGQEALNSQSVGKFANPADYQKYQQHYNEGLNYGWVSSSDRGPPSGRAAIPSPAITYMNKSKDHPGPRKIDYVHAAPGVYTVTFRDQIVYGQTYWDLHATARETERGTYCNIGDIDYKTGRVSVACFDGSGAPRDARWFLSMRRLYN